jgi:hypothetical protein
LRVNIVEDGDTAGFFAVGGGWSWGGDGAGCDSEGFGYSCESGYGDDQGCGACGDPDAGESLV